MLLLILSLETSGVQVCCCQQFVLCMGLLWHYDHIITALLLIIGSCHAFPTDSYMLSVYMDGVHRPLGPTELAVSVKNSCPPGAYCFVYHSTDQPNNQRSRSCPTDPPPAPPEEGFFPAETATDDTVEPEMEEESLISL